MATKIVTKNSSTASAVPTASDLVQGELAVNVADKRLFTEDNGGAIVELGTNPSSLTVTGEITANGGIALGDNDKATFGASDDLQIYHDGSNSYIREDGVGSLRIQGADLELSNPSEIKWLKGYNNNRVELFFNNSKKLATTSTGIDVTGTATMDGLVVNGAGSVVALSDNAVFNVNVSGGTSKTSTINQRAKSSNGSNADTSIVVTGSSGEAVSSWDFKLDTANGALTKAMSIDGSGDISFYEDTGTTPKLFWDASAESLGIGTSSPSAPLSIMADTSASVPAAGADSSHLAVGKNDQYGTMIGSLGSGDGYIQQQRFDGNTATYNLLVQPNGGRVGIGTSSPSQELHVVSSGESDIRLQGSGSANHLDIFHNASDFGLWGTGTQVFKLATNGSERMRIDSSGRVGIGTSSPANTLTIKGSVNQLDIETTTAGVTLESVDRTDLSAQSDLSYYARHGEHKFFGSSYTERMRIDSSGRLLLNKTNNDGSLIFQAQAPSGFSVGSGFYSGATQSTIEFHDANTTANYKVRIGSETDDMVMFAGGSERMRIDSSGNVGIGGEAAAVTHGPHLDLVGNRGTLTVGTGYFEDNGTTNFIGGARSLAFGAGGSGERMRIDSSGNLLVGTTNLTWLTNAGHRTFNNGSTTATVTNGTVGSFNRLSTDGEILNFRKDGTTVGSIGTVDGFPYISSNSNVGLKFLSSRIRPVNSDGSDRDDAIDLGASSARFDDIYATNGTINTSDRNEKQDIAELSDAEQRVAVACKGLLRKFRWKDSVAEKGDDARIHFGIIAQDLQDAFAAEGLDAGDYGMFTSTTWTDEETNEEKTRMGVRYSELLAFIIAAI